MEEFKCWQKKMLVWQDILLFWIFQIIKLEIKGAIALGKSLALAKSSVALGLAINGRIGDDGYRALGKGIEKSTHSVLWIFYLSTVSMNKASEFEDKLTITVRKQITKSLDSGKFCWLDLLITS